MGMRATHSDRHTERGRSSIDGMGLQALTPRAELGIILVAGAFSGMLAAIATHPFDVIKTRQQVTMFAGGKDTAAIGVRAAAREILRESGPQGFFAGLLPRLAKVSPACAIMISSFECGKMFWKHRTKG